MKLFCLKKSSRHFSDDSGTLDDTVLRFVEVGGFCLAEFSLGINNPIASCGSYLNVDILSFSDRTLLGVFLEFDPHPQEFFAFWFRLFSLDGIAYVRMDFCHVAVCFFLAPLRFSYPLKLS